MYSIPDHVILVSKDAMLTSYLPTYGNQYWKTPNIDELAKKGTVFFRHYTAAPSTAMAFTSMFTGLFPYQLDRKDYTEVREYDQGTTLFDELSDRGYECHLLWSKNYIHMADKYSKCYGKNTIRHEAVDLNQSVGVHIPRADEQNHLVPDDGKTEKVMNYLGEVLDGIDETKKIFMWIHLPHVLLGRCGYGQDIDLFDEFIGMLRRKFGDEGIYVTADHGNMDGFRGKTTYGFDVYESAIRIPLIAPRITDSPTVDFPTSNVQLTEMILNGKVSKLPFVLSDSQYYAQPYRKLAIIHDNYKYIYNKLTRKEELYDVVYDPVEHINLLEDKLYDTDRNRYVNAEQVVFYPYRDRAREEYKAFREYFLSIWKTAGYWTEKKNYIVRKLKNFKSSVRRNLFKRGKPKKKR